MFVLSMFGRSPVEELYQLTVIRKKIGKEGVLNTTKQRQRDNKVSKGEKKNFSRT